MRVLISGASGLIGSALSEHLRRDGHETRSLVRREPTSPTEFRWNPESHGIDRRAFDGVDAVVNLSGASIAGRRWTSSYQRKLRASRIDSTTTIVDSMVDQRVDGGPRVLISGSAVGYYGDTGEAEVDETASPGTDFLAQLAADWESCTQPAEAAGIRVSHLRTGIVLAGTGGALGTVLPLFKTGLGGRLGSGQQWLSWISLADEVAAIRWLLDHDALSGAFNLTAPHPARNADYTAAIGRELHRPTVLPAPAFALRLALGELADVGLLVSQRVVPRRLLDSGFSFADSDVEAGVRRAIKQD